MEKLKGTEELLSYLGSLDIKLWVEDDRLKFNAPKGMVTAELRSQIKEQKAEIIAFLQSDLERRTPSTNYRTIERRDRHSDIPLSFIQERFWFLHQLQDSDSSAYNTFRAFQLTGKLNIEALERTLTEIIRRHQVLRARFQLVDGIPIQVIESDFQLNLPVIDLRELSEPEQSQRVEQLTTAFVKQPFDLEQTPLIRASLLQLAFQKYIFILSVHHIAIDGWSWKIFLKELSVIYTAFSSGQPSPLVELAIQYADYAAWQRQWLQGEVLETQLNYWKEQLAGDLPILKLPLDYPRPSFQTYTGATKNFQIPRQLTEKLKRLSQEEGVTLYITLLTAFNILLSRYSGQSDIIVGTPTANRSRPELEDTIGPFVNILLLRTNLKGNPSFRELLARVRKVTLEAYAHQDIPFDLLAEELQPERDLSRSIWFQVFFGLHNFPEKEWELAKIAVTPFNIEKSASRYDMSLDLFENSAELIGKWEYNTNLFDEATIERMIGNFKTLLEAIVDFPSRTAFELPLLTPRERHQLLVEWNETNIEYPKDKCIHQLFEEQVEKTPDAVAVVFVEQELTYWELNCRANKLAHYLQELGVKPGTLVGISVERSLEMIVGLLGILKAGGTYVPLDPTYPSERISYMLENSQVPILLTQNYLKPTLPEYSGRAIALDSDWEVIATESEENPVSGVTPENLIYVIYTSGSTGKPKGAGVYHRGFTNLVNWFSTDFELTTDDRVLIISSFSFDLTQKNFYAPLIVGGQLHLLPSAHYDPQLVNQFVEQHKITCINCTPSVFYPLIEPENESKFLKLASLRYVFLGGEPISLSRLWGWLQSVSCQAQIVNTYGPTECTDLSTSYRLKEPASFLEKAIPLGRSIFNVQNFILSQSLELLPVGVVGELYIGGEGVGAGYLNQPEMTAEKFIEVSFSDEQKVLLYKTGDLARYLPDGNIEFLGRIDNQVKIRGFRIELGEIEVTLAQHPSLREGVVMAREDKLGDKYLVAYVIPNSSQPTIPQLRSFLKSKLPDYMVPSTFVFLEAIPLTPNGKIDRRALPKPDFYHQEIVQIAPRTTTELQLVQIWSEVLNIPTVGVRDNFFDLGGHSLLAVRLMAGIEKQFGTHLPLATLFTEPTIESQASLLSAATNPQLSLPLVPIQSRGSLTPFFCVHPVGGNVLCYAALAGQLGAEQPFYGLQSVGLNGEEEPLTRIENMATTYIKAIQIVQPEGPYQLGGWSFGGIVAFEIAQQLHSLGHKVALLALIDSFNPTILNKPKPDEAMLVTYFANNLSRSFDKELPVSADELRQLRLDEQLNYILEKAKKLQVLPSEIGREQMQQLFAIFQTNFQAMHNYVPQSYSGEITLFCAEEKSEQLAEKQIQSWSSLATGSINIHKIPGDHFSITRSEVLAKDLGLYLRF